MNEGVPVRTIALMVITTVVAAGIVALFLIHCFAPPDYTYRATRHSRGARQSPAAIVQTPTGRITSAAAVAV